MWINLPMTMTPDTRRVEHRRRARAIAAALMVGLLALAGAGCGAASHDSGPGLALSAYLVRGNEETGLPRQGAPTTSTTPAEWTAELSSGQQAAETRLKAEGFHSVILVHTGSASAQGVSWAMELGSPQSAEREQKAQLQSSLHVGGPVGRFSVGGVPTAEGFTYPGPNPQDANALFREGRCLLLVGDQESGAHYQAPVIAAVRAIWARTDTPKGACTS